MKKIIFLIIILVTIIILAAADYFINKPSLEIKRVVTPNEEGVGSEVAKEENFTELLIKTDPNGFGYTLEKRDRTKQIFEKFDLSDVDDVKIYRNTLKSRAEEVSKDPIVIYEIRGLKGEGKLTYLNVKLKIIDQMKEDENINEVDGYGDKSFFYNDLGNEKTAFLFCQVEDNLFGFQYSKSNENGFETIKKMIGALTLL